jgi:hypothetical protein
VVTSKLMTPVDFRDRLLSIKGAAFGIEPVITQLAWFRPHNISRGGRKPVHRRRRHASRRRASRRRVLRQDPRQGRAPCQRPQLIASRLIQASPRVRGGDPRRLEIFPRRLDAAARLDPDGGACALRLLPRQPMIWSMKAQIRPKGWQKSAPGSTPFIAAGRADHPADRAFVAVVEHYAMPRALPEALVEGFEWDVAKPDLW